MNKSEYATVLRDNKEYELWVGFDLDGTLLYDEGWNGCSPSKYGHLLKDTDVYKLFVTLYKMGQTKNDEGKKRFKVKLLTARACESDHADKVRQWARKHSLYIPEDVEVTASKDYGCRAIVDDRAVPVSKNRGMIMCSKQHLAEVFNFV